MSLNNIININNEKSKKSKRNIEIINLGLNLSHTLIPKKLLFQNLKSKIQI